MKPSIAILHYSAPPVIGGVEKVIADHTRWMLKAGYPVTILTGRGGDSKVLTGAKVVVIPEIDTEFPLNVEIARGLDRGRLPAEFEELQRKIERLLKLHLVDQDVLLVHNILTVHYNMPLTSALNELLHRQLLPPTVAWVHDISRHVNPKSTFSQRNGFPWDLLRTYRPDLHYVTVSSRRRQALADTFGCPAEQIAVIPNGVAPESLLSLTDFGTRLIKDLHLYEADLILLMPVRVTRAKNIEFALAVSSALKQAGWNTRLIITGPPDPHSQDSRAYFDHLLMKRGELGLEHEVVFVHEWLTHLDRPFVVDSARIAELYRMTDIVFVPSHREGFGLPVLEAGLARQPVFATGIPAVDEVGVECVHLIPPGESPEQVARRMIDWAVGDVEQRLRRRVRQRFTWQAIFERDIEPLLTRCAQGVKEQV